jgi:hypothetical protein
MIAANRAQMALGWRGEKIATHAAPGNPLAALVRLVVAFIKA